MKPPMCKNRRFLFARDSDALSSKPTADKLSLRDMKLSEYLKRNPEQFPATRGCKCRCKLFYFYLLMILGLGILFICSPKYASKATRAISIAISYTAKAPEPAKSMMYSLVLSAHQLLGIPLQTVSIAMICFATQSFLYGYVLVVAVNLSSCLLIFISVRRLCRKCLGNRFKENTFVQVIKAESALYPVKMSLLFRFMNIPGLYKNISLSLSDISFPVYFLPAILEAVLSNVLICFTGYAMKRGKDSVSFAKKRTGEKAILIFSYSMVFLQIATVVFAAVVTVAKIRKISYLKRMIEIEKERDERATKGYVHDLHQASPTNGRAPELLVEVYKYTRKELAGEAQPIGRGLENPSMSRLQRRKKSLFLERSDLPAKHLAAIGRQNSLHCPQSGLDQPTKGLFSKEEDLSSSAIDPLNQDLTRPNEHSALPEL
jgi:hypothetical protein